MSASRFEEELRSLLSERSRGRAPFALRMRIDAVPDEFPVLPSHPWLRQVAAQAVAWAGVTVILALVSAVVWFRFGPSSTEPSHGVDQVVLTLHTQGSGSASSARSVCSQELVAVRVEQSAGELTFVDATASPQTSPEQTLLVFPTGFSARVIAGRAELVAPDLTVVAHEGDVIRVGGGLDASGTAFSVCSVNGVTYTR